MSAMKSAHCTYTYGIIKLLNFTSDFLKLGCSSFEMLWNYILNCDITTGSCCSEHKGSCLNLVRNDGILCAVKLLNTLDTDHICTSTFDIGSHAVQEVGNIYYVWLSGSIFNNRTSWCKRCCHHNIDSCSYRNYIQENMASMKIRCLGNNGSMKNINFRTKGSETFQMLVNRTASDIAATWKRNFCSFIFAK